jgi:DNA-binding LacI/PurR family transcriptional regulator
VEQAVTMLLARIAGRDQPMVSLVPGELIVRATARMPSWAAPAETG